MKNKYDLICEEVQQAKDSICPNSSDMMRFYYRGHADIDWELVPTIIRSEKEVTECSEIRRAMSDGNWSLNDNLFANIARMQHYGYATRFLDYTTNLDVALYFACSDEKCCNRDGCISICAYTNDRHVETIDTIVISELALMTEKKSLMDFATSIVANHGRSIEKEKQSNANSWKFFDFSTKIAWDIAGWLNHGFMVTPTECDMKELKKNNPRIFRQEGAFFVFGNKTNPPTAPTVSTQLDSVTIFPNIREKTMLIRPGIFRNPVINVEIRNEWKPQIMEELTKKGITREYLFPDEV